QLYRPYCKFRRQSPRRKEQARCREGLRHGLLESPAMTMLRRIALAMATLASVVALPSCEHEPPPASAAEHRVLLERPPVEVALWFVHRYPSYFKSGERRI